MAAIHWLDHSSHFVRPACRARRRAGREGGTELLTAAAAAAAAGRKLLFTGRREEEQLPLRGHGNTGSHAIHEARKKLKYH